MKALNFTQTSSGQKAWKWTRKPSAHPALPRVAEHRASANTSGWRTWQTFLRWRFRATWSASKNFRVAARKQPSGLGRASTLVSVTGPASYHKEFYVTDIVCCVFNRISDILSPQKLYLFHSPSHISISWFFDSFIHIYDGTVEYTNLHMLMNCVKVFGSRSHDMGEACAQMRWKNMQDKSLEQYFSKLKEDF